jgi:hypothetical protein
MKHKIAVVIAILFTANLAANYVAAQNAPAVAASDASAEIPENAAKILAQDKSRTERARQAYWVAIKAERGAAERKLQRELAVETKRGDFNGAHAILAAEKELQTKEPENGIGIPMDASDTRSQIVKVLPGKWSIHTGPKFQAVWTINRDGTVLANNGAPTGHWKWEPQNRRILFTWDADKTAWDSLNLPLNEKGTFGDTYHRVGWRVEAVKLP